jgi:hypothetical protein
MSLNIRRWTLIGVGWLLPLYNRLVIKLVAVGIISPALEVRQALMLFGLV